MSFARQLQKIADKRKQDIGSVARSSIIEIGNLVISESPVDTGRFRINWQFELDFINYSTKESKRKLSPEKSVELASGKLVAKVDNFALGQVFYMTNNLPYARALEFGHSGQAPHGMVRTSVANWGRMVDAEVGKVKS